ncbi:MAG: D-alanine--D-alanyl carrier protein ligase [Legionella sp.]|uniref:amino acid adenylation domain-containing protein n=1 Tax=Legionella sp. TaxID=459 RepID=UPI003D0EF928
MSISCLLMGEDSLLIQCGQFLLDKGHHIKWVISPVKSIQYWCEDNNISWCASFDELFLTDDNRVDYLFSIVNSTILTQKQLDIARLGAINYHDSLLPSYAGVNATTWSLINGESTHGITWHELNVEIDAGSIIHQSRVPIFNEDTALTLNLRCFEAAINGFEQVIKAIETSTIQRQIQDIKQRSYYGVTHVVPDLGFINWNTARARDIERTNRALTFGHYNNNVGLLKLYLGHNAVVVREVKPVEDEGIARIGGQLLAIKPEGLLISTQCGSVLLNGFYTLYGVPLSMDELVRCANLRVNSMLPCFDGALIQHYHPLYKKCLKEEPFWLKQLLRAEEHTLFSKMATDSNSTYKQLGSVCSDSYAMKNVRYQLLVCVFIYLYRLNNYEPFTVFYNDDELNELGLCGGIFSSLLPLTFESDREITPQKLMQELTEQINEIKTHGTYLTDIFMRHPDLETKQIDFVITLGLSKKEQDVPPNSLIHFEINEQNELVIYHRLNKKHQGGGLSSILTNMPQHLENILQWMYQNSNQPIHNMCFLTTMERENLNDWGVGQNEELPSTSITQLFEHQVITHPERIAIYENNYEFSYHHLWEQSEKIASFINTLNVPQQTLIGIYIPRSHNMLALILGILKAGCVYVPLDLRYPLLKIEMIINESKLTHLMTIESQMPALMNQFGQSVHLYNAEELLARNENSLSLYQDLENPSVNNPLAYIMFTSGTTGTPKGVMVSQKNVINYCHWFTQSNGFTADSIIDFSSSLAFDLSVPCTLAPLLVGGALAICDEQQKINPKLYLQHLKRYAITHTELTPGYLELLLHYPEDIKQLGDLRYVLLGADVVHTEEVTQWLALCPTSTIVNEYGPTETTVSATSYCVTELNDLTEASVPIGRPAFNSTCYLLDKYFNLCPIGMMGELYIGGAQVTEGYLGKPELTEQKFIKMKFNEFEETLYKTGDLASWLPKGHLQFFGRNDHQVKIQGYRIELPAIESILMKHEAIFQAVVVIREERHKEKYLRAYIVSEDKNINTHQIKEFLALYLPAYMHPKEFCVVSSIPLKENEKIDFDTLERQASILLAYNPELSNQALNDTQRICLDIWQKAFLSQVIHLEDNFFELGGDSLLALQIISALKSHFKLPIPLSVLFECPDIISLAHQLDILVAEGRSTHAHASSSVIKLSSGPHKTPLFLVHPVGGSVFWYQQLAQRLDGKYTIYGIEDQSVNGHSRRFASISEMAQFYLEEIDKVYQGEEYCLGGASFGATVAVEMVNQLMRSNKSVTFLGLFDGWAKYPDSLIKSNTMGLLSKSEEIGQQTSEHLQELEEYRKKLLLAFELPTIRSDITLFKAKDLWDAFVLADDPFNGWEPFVEHEITVHSIPGTHETMFFESNVDHLANLVELEAFSKRKR